MLTDEQKQEIHDETGAGHALICLVEAAATAPLLERIAELEELNSLNNQLINTQHRVMVNAEQRGVAKGLEECAEQIAALTAQLEARLAWIEQKLFVSRWNGVIDSGAQTTWQLSLIHI